MRPTASRRGQVGAQPVAGEHGRHGLHERGVPGADGRRIHAVQAQHLRDHCKGERSRQVAERATMSMLVTPQMLNTMDTGSTEAFLRRPRAPLHDPGVQRPTVSSSVGWV
ncbi:MAG: hypothetical protein IRY90_05550 [Actinomadura rubrobrunea]|nr:hypothetical protein [Actinomadura rubrobrunea]